MVGLLCLKEQRQDRAGLPRGSRDPSLSFSPFPGYVHGVAAP